MFENGLSVIKYVVGHGHDLVDQKEGGINWKKLETEEEGYWVGCRFPNSTSRSLASSTM